MKPPKEGERRTSVQRAVLLVSGSSALVPAVGLATAPVLAHSLGAEGRGITAAATAPFLVASTAGSLGLPQALTFFVARGRRLRRPVVVVLAGITIAVGLLAAASVALGRGFLSGGDPSVAELIVLGTLFVVPALLVGLLRGIAIGLQKWRCVAIDRVVQTLTKAVALVGLAVVGELDVLSAVIVLCVTPVVGVVAYHRILLGLVRLPSGEDEPPVQTVAVLRYGSSVWLGSVALMLMARVNELFVLPLSDATQLGLLVVAVTVSDIPWIVTQALRDVLFGSSSRTMDWEFLARASRVATAAAAGLGVAMGCTLPLWLSLVFGSEFDDSLWPTVVLLVSAAVAVPGLVSGAGLEAAGRPQARSLTLVATLVVNVVLVFSLAPAFGAVGAAGAVLGSTAFSSIITARLAFRALGVRPLRFVVLDKTDVRAVAEQVRTLRANRAAGGDTPANGAESRHGEQES